MFLKLFDFVFINVSFGIPDITHKITFRWGFCAISDEEQVELLLQEIENDSTLTLEQLARKGQALFGIRLSKSTVHNYLRGRIVTLKKIHYQPVSMNTEEKKQMRQQYVQAVSDWMAQGKTIIWMDETNINLFCRRSQGRARAGARAVCKLPNSKGPNVHVIAAVSAYELVYWTRRRGAFSAEKANAWILEMLHLPQGLSADDVVIVCDNAPCHSKLEQCLRTHPGFKIL